MASVTRQKQQIFLLLDLVWLTPSWNERGPTRHHYKAIFLDKFMINRIGACGQQAAEY